MKSVANPTIVVLLKRRSRRTFRSLWRRQRKMAACDRVDSHRARVSSRRACQLARKCRRQKRSSPLLALTFKSFARFPTAVSCSSAICNKRHRSSPIVDGHCAFRIVMSTSILLTNVFRLSSPAAVAAAPTGSTAPSCDWTSTSLKCFGVEEASRPAARAPKNAPLAHPKMRPLFSASRAQPDANQLRIALVRRSRLSRLFGLSPASQTPPSSLYARRLQTKPFAMSAFAPQAMHAAHLRAIRVNALAIADRQVIAAPPAPLVVDFARWPLATLAFERKHSVSERLALVAQQTSNFFAQN